MSSKHFISDPVELVKSSLTSLTLSNPSVALDEQHKIVYRRPSPQDADQKTALVSGGGSGHEPSFSGFVGKGLLSAAVAGSIFASPSARQVQTAIMGRVPASQDVLVIVMNYTGDILNFGVAVEKAKALGEGNRKVEMIVVADDVGVGRSRAGKVGRRGIAGTVLVAKIAGALAARGFSLENVARAARTVGENIVSVGASLAHVHVPGRVPDREGLGGDQVELGMGIHNEPGSSTATLTRLEDLVDEMLRQLLDYSDEDRAFLKVDSKEVVLLVNNLGGVSVLEMGGVLNEVVGQLKKKYNIYPARVLAGAYMTSLNGLGFSISLLNTVPVGLREAPSMIELLEDYAEATGWSPPIRGQVWEENNTKTRTGDQENALPDVTGSLIADPAELSYALTMGLREVVSIEPEVTQYDSIVGDGDCGIGLKRGAEAIMTHLSCVPLSGNVVADLATITLEVERTMDGTSGALCAIFLHSLVNALRQMPQAQRLIETADWAKALKLSLEALAKYTPAQPGDRTFVDALFPFVETLERTMDVKEAARAAKRGAEGTKGMKPGLGRSVYVGGEGYSEVPDPGAWGLAGFLMGIAGLC